MPKVSSPPPSPPVVVSAKSRVELEVSQAYLSRQSAPARLARPVTDVFHDSDLKPLRLARTELRQLKSHLRAVGLLKTRSMPGTFAIEHDDIDGAVSSAPLSHPHAELAKAAFTTLHQDSRRLGALRAAKRHLDSSIAAEPQAAEQLAPLRHALQREMVMPEPLLETLREMHQVLVEEPQAMPVDLSSLPRRSRIASR